MLTLVDAEILVAGFAMTWRVRNLQFLRTPRHQIADIMYLPHANALTRNRAPATRAETFWRIAVFLDNLELGQILDPCKPQIRLIPARTQLGPNFDF